MSDTKSGSKSASKTNLNESTLPLLEEQEGKGETPEKEEKIEMETKGGENKEDKDKNDSAANDDKKDKKKKEKKEKKPKESKPCRTINCAQNFNSFTVGLNVIDRDDKHINDQVNLSFDDILGEPDTTQGFEFIWRLTYLFFTTIRLWAYRIISAVIALPLALLWAFIFAFLNVGTIWCFTPSLRLFDIGIHHLHRIWSGLVRCVLDPFFASAGLLWGNIRTSTTNNVVTA